MKEITSPSQSAGSPFDTTTICLIQMIAITKKYFKFLFCYKSLLSLFTSIYHMGKLSSSTLLSSIIQYSILDLYFQEDQCNEIQNCATVGRRKIKCRSEAIRYTFNKLRESFMFSSFSKQSRIMLKYPPIFHRHIYIQSQKPSPLAFIQIQQTPLCSSCRGFILSKINHTLTPGAFQTQCCETQGSEVR